MQSADDLYGKYPDLFKSNEKLEIGCGAGWFDMLDELLGKMEEINSDKIKILAVRDKNGRVKIDMEKTGDDVLDLCVGSLIFPFEMKSMSICSTCGKPGQTVNIDGKKFTRCPKHISD